MNNRSKQKFILAVERSGLYKATNGNIPAVIQQERHKDGVTTRSKSYDGLTNAELRTARKLA